MYLQPCLLRGYVPRPQRPRQERRRSYPSSAGGALRAAAGVDAADYITERPVIAGVHLVRALGELEDEALGVLLVAWLGGYLWKIVVRLLSMCW